MVAVTKIRIKFGPEGPVKTFQSFPGVDNCSNAKRIEHSIGEDIFISADQSKKRGPSKVLDEVQPKKKQKLDSALSTQCLILINFLLKHPVGGLFKEPVDPVKLGIPDYFSIITKPMDLGTIKTKLLKKMYSHVDEFAADVRLTISNALRYNPPYSWAHNLAMELKELFEARWELLKKKKISKLSGIKVDCSIQSSSETSASSGRFSVELSKPAKDKSEKVPLWSKLVEGQRKKDTPAATPKALATKLKIKKLDQGLGVCSAVKIPSKGSAPTAACKCVSCGRYTCICLKSCNSSGSDVSSLTHCQLKNTSGSLASESDPNCNGSVSSRNEKNGCVSSQLDKPSNGALLDIELKTASLILPPLAPEKALRAAKLKDKFAETIIKAKRRIILQQSNKADLISIQIEKEQMERIQREEKARIEAEMRAAKIATRMRAQAELKQKRERQRLELEKMEIDYDFEQNNHSKLEKDVVDVCGCSSRRLITKTRLLFEEELGLVLRNDDCPEMEEIESENFDAMRVDDLEEGEIF